MRSHAVRTGVRYALRSTHSALSGFPFARSGGNRLANTLAFSREESLNARVQLVDAVALPLPLARSRYMHRRARLRHEAEARAPEIARDRGRHRAARLGEWRSDEHRVVARH